MAVSAIERIAAPISLRDIPCITICGCPIAIEHDQIPQLLAESAKDRFPVLENLLADHNSSVPETMTMGELLILVAGETAAGAESDRFRGKRADAVQLDIVSLDIQTIQKDDGMMFVPSVFVTVRCGAQGDQDNRDYRVRVYTPDYAESEGALYDVWSGIPCEVFGPRSKEPLLEYNQFMSYTGMPLPPLDRIATLLAMHIEQGINRV